MKTPPSMAGAELSALPLMEVGGAFEDSVRSSRVALLVEHPAELRDLLRAWECGLCTF